MMNYELDGRLKDAAVGYFETLSWNAGQNLKVLRAKM
jgi:hypothetical protein